MTAKTKAAKPRKRAAKKSTAKDCGNVSSTKSAQNRNAQKKSKRSTDDAPKAAKKTSRGTSQPKSGSAPAGKKYPVNGIIAGVGVADILPIPLPPVAPGCVSFGKHRGKTWADVPREYLQWMVDNSHTAVADARAELGRRDAPPPIKIVLAPAAIDEASLKLRDYWDATRGTWEGLHSWLIRIALAALRSSPMFERGGDRFETLSTESNGIRFEFSAEAKTGDAPTYILETIKNPKAGIAWRSDTRAGMARADYADRRKVTGQGVW